MALELKVLENTSTEQRTCTIGFKYKDSEPDATIDITQKGKEPEKPDEPENPDEPIEPDEPEKPDGPIEPGEPIEPEE